MTRFEIQDILFQNADGVTFRAVDNVTGKTVALRRFFPFGKDEEGNLGLDKTEGKAFASACERLSSVRHPALRRTIKGDVDPIDGMPYLITEWLEGESLNAVLNGKLMEPEAILKLVRDALEICVLLSETLQNEAIWIDTKPDAIIVCNPDNNPTYSFRICPFKWLGTQAQHRDLMGIVEMVEHLIGWKSKLVSDQAGMGLGGLLKAYRRLPQMPLAEAIRLLPSPEGGYVPPVYQTESKPTQSAATAKPPADIQQPPVLVSANPSFFNKTSLTVTCVSACLVIALISFLYIRNNEQLKQSSQQQKLVDRDNAASTSGALKPLSEAGKSSVSGTNSDDVNAKALRMKEELAKLEMEKKLVTQNQDQVLIIEPNEVQKLAHAKLNRPVSIRGVVKSVNKPQKSEGIYFSFVDPSDDKHVQVALFAKSFEGGPHSNESLVALSQEYQGLVGKTVVFSGSLSKHAGRKGKRYVLITAKNQIVPEK